MYTPSCFVMNDDDDDDAERWIMRTSIISLNLHT